MGRGAVHTRLRGRRVTLVPVEVAGREATRNVCGVLVAMPQGQSWAPTPSIGMWWTWEVSRAGPVEWPSRP